MSQQPFDIGSLLEEAANLRGNPTGMLAALAEGLRQAGRWHELLQVRLIEARVRVGLPPDGGGEGGSITDAPAEKQPLLEQSYSEACVEVAEGLIADQQYRDAWYYLNTAGRPEIMQQALAKIEPTDENVDELVEIALHHGADPARGYRWMLERFGTCNSVTALEGMGPQLPVADLAGCAAILATHLHGELSENVSGHIDREEGKPPSETSLPEMMDKRPWLFEFEAAHVDASHLSAAVRMARVLTNEDPALQHALELSDYGRRLQPSLQYPDAAPFEETYKAHHLFFAAQMKQASESEIEEAVTFFTQRAEAADIDTEGLAPLETLLVLLGRIGRPADALSAFGKLMPAGAGLSPYAPRPLDLAQQSGDWETYDQIMRDRNDLVAFALGQLKRSDS